MANVRINYLVGGGFVLLILVGIYSVFESWSPSPLRRDAPPDRFSAERAWESLVYPTSMVHPYGTQENLKVRDYWIQKLKLLGVDPEVKTEYLVHSSKEGHCSVERVDNIIVVLPGYSPTRAILVMGHYDSTPYGFGCADDGSAVATMYETIRALLNYPPLRNDVVFLFTDGEEAGTLGPKAFMKHPLFGKVGLCLNFEARGHYGPSMMFQTNSNNEWLIKEFAKAVPYPRANSMMFDIAGKMPTSTDYYVLKPKGVPGFDFAFVGGIRFYHTPNDNIFNISLRSLQHHGEYALPLIKHFGNLDLSGLTIGSPFENPTNNRIYFPVPHNNLISYHQCLVLPLMVVAVVLYLILLIINLVFWRLSILDIVRSFTQAFMLVLVNTAVLALFIGGAFLLHKHYIVYYELTYLFSALLITFGTFFVLLPLIIPKVDPHSFYVAILLPWVVFCVHSSVFSPSASYVPTWITIVGSLVGITISIMMGVSVERSKLVMISILPGIIAIYIFVPFLVVGAQTLTPIFLPLLAILIIYVFFLSPGIMIHIIDFKDSFRKIGMVSFLIGFIIYLYPTVFLSPTSSTPWTTHLVYGVDWDKNEAYWMTLDKHPNEWTRNFLKEFVGKRKPEEFCGDNIEAKFYSAPLASYPKPGVNILKDITEGDLRRLKISVVSVSKAPQVNLRLEGKFCVIEAYYNGRKLESSDEKSLTVWSFNYRGFPEPIILEWTLRVDEPLRLVVTEKHYGVGNIPGVEIPPLPSSLILEPNTVEWWRPFRSNAIYLRKTYNL
ncbi:MAG: M28 family peptidase [Candidatus Hydrogenedentes bacterium]|nr:M28 family peptidase [Candidatus Hydrogenedentota bacterium]